MSDDEAIIESLSENIQRGDLEIEEIAEAYNLIRRLSPKTWTQEAFASKVGKSQKWLSTIMTAYQLLIKLRQVGKQYKMKLHPTEEEQKKGVLPYTVLAEIEHALKAKEVRKVIPEEKMDEIRVGLVEVIKGESQENAKSIINYFKMYPEKIMEKGIEEGLKEIKDLALKEKTGVPLKTYVPASVMRKVKETAEELGKPVEVILPTILERGIEEEARKVEVERLLEKAPAQVVKVAQRLESTMTPKVIRSLLELPEERQREALGLIESLRPTEEEALSYIESIKAEVSMPPEKEIEAIKKRYEEVQQKISEIIQRPEVRARGELFRNWHSHYIIAQGLQDAFCPVCGKERTGSLVWSCCGLPAKEALKVAGDKFEESQKKD